MPLIALAMLIMIPASSWAYPEFIGYGYSSCLTCHYNGQGNGPLNDYGRALWAAEIAGRTFAGKKTDEELAASSGFLGSTKLPYWLRPGVKTRNLMFAQQPITDESTMRHVWMQAEANVAILFDKKSDLIFVGSYGYAPTPYRYEQAGSGQDIDNGISREHYLRWHRTKKHWMYLGMMDKVFGIRHVNHYAYSRARTGLAQNDQSHGLVSHYIDDKWELTINGFMGNLFQDSDLRQKGASMMFEYEPSQNWRIGTSFLASSNSYVRQERFALHSKKGLSYGSSFLVELGLIRDAPKAEDLKQGYYLYSQATQKVVRGTHVFFSGQVYKEDMKNSKGDDLRFGVGVIYFPRNRFELRIEGENWRRLASDGVTADTWNLMSQLHISL